MAFDKIDIPIMIGREQYYIGSDKFNVMLGKKKMVSHIRKGVSVESFEFESSSTSYYSSLDNLMTDLHLKLIKSKKASTIMQLQKNVTRSRNEILAKYKTIKEEELDGEL